MQSSLPLHNTSLPKLGHAFLRRRYARQFPRSAAYFLHTSSVPQQKPEDLEVVAARQWFSSFGSDTIPRSICEVSFSRASGPGGQNVNKVNSKATLRVPLSSLLPLLPSILHPEIRASRYCKDGSGAIVIQADESRKQKDNTHQCFAKLENMILAAARITIPGETSDAQRQHVKVLQTSANEQRLRTKKMASSKKSARRSRFSSDD